MDNYIFQCFYTSRNVEYEMKCTIARSDLKWKWYESGYVVIKFCACHLNNVLFISPNFIALYTYFSLLNIARNTEGQKDFQGEI